MAVWTVQAAYDLDDQIWYVVDSDIPGLSTSGESLARLRWRVEQVMPELIEDNAHLILDKSRLTGPHQLRVIAFHESTLPVAA